MGCPEENIAFWPADLWVNPLSELQLGVIPVIWTTGSLPNEAGGDSDPWMGRRIPDKFTWVGNSVELQYRAGFYERGLCLTAFPRVLVRIQGFCLWGVNNIFISVYAGNRSYWNHFKALHGNDGIFLGTPLRTVDCKRKYADTEKDFSVNVRSLVDWLGLCAEYCLNAEGTPGPWWEEAINFTAGDTALFRPCSGCEYGFLETSKGLAIGTWEDLQLDVFPDATFPLKRDSGMRRVSIGCPDSHALVVDTATGDADKYMRIKISCEDLDSYIRSELFIPEECFLPDDELPSDDDVRWIPKPNCAPTTCGQAIGGRYLSDVAYVFYGSKPAPRAKYVDGALKVIDDTVEATLQLNSWMMWEEQTFLEYSRVPNGACVGKTRTNGESTIASGMYGSHLIFRWGSDGAELYNPSVWAAESEQISANASAFRDSLTDAVAAAKFQPCGYKPLIAEPTPAPIIRPRAEIKGDGNCYIAGDFALSLRISLLKLPVLDKVATFSQQFIAQFETAVGNRIVSRVLNSIITIPFKFKLPQGQSELGDVSVTLIGTVIQVSSSAGTVTTTYEELTNYYNFANAAGLVSLINPLPVTVKNLRAFCE